MRNLYLLVGFMGLSIVSIAQTKKHLITPISKTSTSRSSPINKHKSRVGIYKTQKFLNGPRAENSKPWKRTGKWTPIQGIATRKYIPKGPEAKNNPLGRKNLKSSKEVMRFLLFKKDPFLVSTH